MVEPATSPGIAPDLLASLLDPRSYRHAPAEVTLVQTHISCVFLAGSEVFKVKKAVRFSFLDFSTLERRRHFCEEEVRLNRRLAPGVYVGVVPITRHGHGYRVDGSGEPVEYAVHMRRLPADRLLRVVVERGEAEPQLIRRIAEKMAAFHATADAGPEIAAGGDPAEMARILEENFANLAPFAAALESEAALEDLRLLVTSALARLAPRLRARQAAGRIRDCHGDLRPDHICCTRDLPIFDCIEFNPRFRHCDVASEMAFLAMELAFLGAPALSRALIDAYVAASGDTELAAVLPIFHAYRAQVRAMVAALTSAEPEVEVQARARALEEARRYLALAERDAWAAHAPLLIVVAGVSGTGKSTLAGALAARSGLRWMRSDVMRKRLAGLDPLARPATPAQTAALYSHARSAELYAALAAAAGDLARAGSGAILDATFLRRADRDELRAAAERGKARLFWIECQASAATIRARLEQRAARSDDPSDATWDVARTQLEQCEPFDELAPDLHLVLATDDGGDGLAPARAWLARRLAATALS